MGTCKYIVAAQECASRLIFLAIFLEVDHANRVEGILLAVMGLNLPSPGNAIPDILFVEAIIAVVAFLIHLIFMVKNIPLF